MKRNESELVHIGTNENLAGSNVLDIVLYRFRNLVIRRVREDEAIGIDIDGPQSEVVSLFHYVVGYSYFMSQRIREREKMARNSKNIGPGPFSPKGSTTDILIRLPKDYSGTIRLLICDGSIDIDVPDTSISLRLATANAHMKHTGPLTMECGDSNVIIDEAKGRKHVIKAINSTVNINSGSVSGLDMTCESMDDHPSEIDIAQDVRISGKTSVLLQGYRAKITYGDINVLSEEDIPKRIIVRKPRKQKKA